MCLYLEFCLVLEVLLEFHRLGFFDLLIVGFW